MTDRFTLTFTVRGGPVPQGSARAFLAGGKARLATRSTPLLAWRTAIATAAGTAMGDQPVREVPTTVLATFTLPRPRSVRRPVPSVKPDLDKLARALLDGMTGVVLRDDSLVVDLLVGKRYGDVPGVRVEVMDWMEAP